MGERHSSVLDGFKAMQSIGKKKYKQPYKLNIRLQKLLLCDTQHLMVLSLCAILISLYQTIILQLPLFERFQKSHPLKLMGNLSFGFIIHFLSTARQVKTAAHALLVKKCLCCLGQQAFMCNSCSHGVHKSWRRSEANPLPPHTGTILDAKWSLPVMGVMAIAS